MSETNIDESRHVEHEHAPSQTTAVATAEAPVREHFRPWLPADVFRGAFLGDYARLGTAGYVTQAAVGFVPFVGTLCAVRDLTADLRQRDRIGASLNVLSLIPFLGGFPKTARVIRSVRDTGNAVQFGNHLYRSIKE